jgi:uncharacterized membrane protein
MARKKITKKEKQGIMFILIGIVVFAFLTDPVTQIIGENFTNPYLRFVIGVSLIILIAYVGKLNNVMK